MLIILKESGTSASSADSGVIAQSVVTNTSIVAMFGWIMPEPFAIPPIWQLLPPAVKLNAISLTFVSVVMIASAASQLPSLFRAAVSASIPPAIGARSSFCPITPVDATTTSDAQIPVCFSTSAHIPSAISMPFELQVFAFPEFTMTACAYPSARLALVTVSGAPFTRFSVYTAAADAFFSLTISARSLFFLFFLIPQ